MRFPSAFLGFCLLICSCIISVNSEQRGLHQRQNNDASSAPASPALTPTSSVAPIPITSSGSPVPTTSASGSSGTTSVGQSSASASSSDGSSISSGESSSSASGSSSPSSGSSQTSTTLTATPTSTTALNGTINQNTNVLPIQPVVTPGLSVAGIILLLTGIAYTLIGIKNKWLHIFLSTAFLTSLSVTVLVVYVMNPPISNSVQGAYVVAAVITGLVFGAASIVFTEVTEGLGCLFGGFCVGMWILVLKPGGLVTSTSGRAILIVAFCLSFFALSFTHYTRTYGLIAGTSFGGATVVVLGIDCFSRAGLKEFWLYIWNLNSDIFPINTNTYPHTRGIRVEIAAIIIIFLMGLTSQMKLWKVVKERREKRAAVRLEDERNLEQEEANVGRRVERSTNRDRAQWEAVYGNKDRAHEYHADSGIGDDMDSVKKDGSMVETRGISSTRDDIELEELEGGRRQETGILSKRGSKEADGIVVRVARDDEIRQVDEDGNTIVHPHLSPSPLGNTTPRKTSFTENRSTGAISKRSSFASPPPTNVPLPFAIPMQQVERDDDESSLTTSAGSERGDVPPVPVRNSRRPSRDTSRRASLAGRRPMSTSSEALVNPHDDDDASSVTATVDSLTDDGESSGGEIAAGSKKSPKAPKKVTEQASATDQHNPATALTTAALSSMVSDMGKADGHKTVSSPPTESDADSVETAKAPEAKSIGNSKRAPTTIPDEAAQDIHGPAEHSIQPSAKPSRSRAPSEASERQSFHESLTTQFPDRISKVVMTYRTNEWAKHLTSADRPELDDIELAPSAIEDDHPKEAAAPVIVEELQQTPMNAVPVPAPRSTSQVSLQSNALSPSLAKSDPAVSNPQLRPALSSYPSNHSIYNSPAQQSLSQLSIHNGSSNNSQSSVHLPAQHSQSALHSRSLRNSSTDLLNQPLYESPIEDAGLPSRPPSRAISSPSPQQTLIGKRDSLIKNKYSSTNIQHLSPRPGSLSSVIGPPMDSTSVQDSRHGGLEEDDIPLAQRREMIRRGSSVGSQIGHSPYPSSRQGSVVSSQDLTFDSHQPKREAGPTQDRRELMLASWRESVRQDLASTVQPKIEVETRREEMLMQRRQSLVDQQQKEHERSRRTSVIDHRMRKGDMMEAHKEAIRKMQATANKNV